MISIVQQVRRVTATADAVYAITVQPTQRTVRVGANVMAFVSETYVHDQASASAVWAVNHSLGKYPSVQAVDSTKRIVYGIVEHVNANQLTITFSAAFSGYAYCN